MSGFRLTDGSDGCPPSETPPSNYVNPFRFDSAGRLWITSCFKGYKFFGAARHDTGAIAMGSAQAPVNNPWPGLPGAAPITSGTYRNVTVINDTECTFGLLYGLDMTTDMTTLCASYVSMHVAAQWNGSHLSSSSYTNPQIPGMSGNLRQFGNISANAHDIGIEGGGAHAVTLAPGASGVISARLYLSHTGAVVSTDVINSASSAIRVYGFAIS